jgi:hypothetical protein
MENNTMRSDAQSRHPLTSTTNGMSLSGVWQRHAAARQPLWSVARWRRMLKKFFA